MALDQNYWVAKTCADVGAPLPGGPPNQDPILGQYLTALATQMPAYYLDAQGQVIGPGGTTTASVVQLVYLFARGRPCGTWSASWRRKSRRGWRPC